MTPDDILSTGKYRYRFYRSPHIPHGWDAGVLFEETRKTLFCSDLFHHFGNVGAVTSSDLIDPTRATAMQRFAARPASPATCPTPRQTEGVLQHRHSPTSTPKPWPSCTAHPTSARATGLLIDLAGVIKENCDQA